MGWAPAVSAGGTTGVRGKKPGERALEWAKTQKSQSQQSYAHCCSGCILYNYACQPL